MSEIKNVPMNLDPLVATYRSMLEHRATWMYLMLDEAKKAGLTDEFTEKAIFRCGIFHGEGTSKPANTTSLKHLCKESFKEDVQQKIFEMDIKECTDDRFEVHFHYCPLVAAWKKLGVPDSEMGRLCQLAMMGDRGIAEAYGCTLDLPKTIADGDDVCQIIFNRK